MDFSDPVAAVIYVTVPNREAAESIAEAVVSERVAACVNILPGFASVYRWKGEIIHSDELLLIMKSSVEAFDRLCDTIQRLHPYDVPEIIMLPVKAGLDRYIEWLNAEVALQPEIVEVEEI